MTFAAMFNSWYFKQFFPKQEDNASRNFRTFAANFSLGKGEG
jgi:hypothetical protein